MRGSFVAILARLLAVTALITQVLMPVAMAVGAQRSPELMAYFCSTPGEDVSAKQAGTKQIGAELAALLADKAGDGQTVDFDLDCHDCVLNAPAPLPEAVYVRAPEGQAAQEDCPLYEARFFATPRGPPLGARAPPLSTDL